MVNHVVVSAIMLQSHTMEIKSSLVGGDYLLTNDLEVANKARK
jgi:hypothetical protein